LENKLGNYIDKDGDGYVAWYPDPKKPNEPAGAGVDQSIIDANDADPEANPGKGTGASSGSQMQYSAGVYPIYTPGKPGKPAVTKSEYGDGGKPKIVVVKPAEPATEGTVEYVDRAGLKQWLNKNLDTATIKQYQQVLKNATLLPPNYSVNGKIDIKGQFAGAIVKVIQNQQDRGVDAETLADGIEFVKQNYGSAAGEATLPTASVTSKEAALADIQDTFRATFGVAAPKEIINAYRDELKALELSRTSKRTTTKGVSVGTYGVSELERKNVMSKYINQYATIIIDGVTLGDPVAVASLQKGNFGLAYGDLRSTYADNGIPINDKSLAQLALDSTVSPEKAKANINLARLQAKTFYPALANQIDNGYTVKQLLSPYLQTRANILEEDPDAIDIKELTKVASDPKGLMGLYDYEVSLRNDPKWRYTKNAQDSISNVARGIAQSFGLVG
jgi:hypothetical protein